MVIKRMSELGYLVRQEHVQAAIDKAPAEDLPRLEGLLEMVAELDALERTLAERVRSAKADAGLSQPGLSKSAEEAVAQSADAHREIDRLLTRKCNRAESSQAVIKEILAVARLDMRDANTLDEWVPDGDPTKAIYSERYWKRREFVETLRAFIASGKK